MRGWIGLCCIAVFAGCTSTPTGSTTRGPGNDSDGGGDGDTETLSGSTSWSRTLVQNGISRGLAIDVSAQGQVAILAINDAGELVLLQGPADGPVQSRVISATPSGVNAEETQLQVKRGNGDVVHMAWSLGDRPIQYARLDESVTVETVGSLGRRPVLRLASDNTARIASVSPGQAYYAFPASGGWVEEAVSSGVSAVTSAFDTLTVGFDLGAGDEPVVAYVYAFSTPFSSAGVVWATRSGAAQWAEETITNAARYDSHLFVSHAADGVPRVIVIGLGLATAYERRSASWTQTHGPLQLDNDKQPFAVFFEEEPLALTDRLQRLVSGGYSQRLMDGCSAGQLAMAVGGAHLHVPFVCADDGELYLMKSLGHFGPERAQMCSSIASSLCATSCTCPSLNGDCCVGVGNGSVCTSSAFCASNMANYYCSDPTVGPEALAVCDGALAQAACVSDAFSTPAACSSIPAFFSE